MRCVRYILLIQLTLLLPGIIISLHAQQQRPKIGLTLSGGGAKGLAHIGILKAIDSAGIKIDYITGTSMGSIVGGLYAIGYSGNDIEQMARKIDWHTLLTNQSSLQAIVMQEKEEYSKYAVELPWVNNGFRLPSGVVEGEELWLKFAELFFPVYNIKDFNQFSIPFKSVSTDLASAQAVVSDSGEIVTAIRSSMAIPSVFTAIDHNGKKLVDGGIVSNFPVQEVKKMGAEYVIGSRVAMGLQPKEKLDNPIKILLQIAFFKEAISSKEDIKLCDIYIPMPLENYTAASFSRADEILEFGVEEGRRLYPVFKQLADSLDNIYGKTYIVENRLPTVDSVFIAAIHVKGLEETTKSFFEHMMGFEAGHYYTQAKLARMVRKVFGTRYYNRIIYSLEPLEKDSANIVFDVVENPTTFAKLGIHYNNFTGISLIGNLTSRNFFLPHSRSLVTFNIGENFRTRAEHLQYLGRGKNVALQLGIQYEKIDINTYSNFRKDGVYGFQMFKADSRLEYSANRKFTIGIGTRFEWLDYRPGLQSVFEIRGKNDFITSYGFFGVNTLNKNIYPTRGLKIEGEFGKIYKQRPEVRFYSNGVLIPDIDSIGISFNDYHRVILNAEGYLAFSNKLTGTGMFQSGLNFRYNQSTLNEFNIGGLNKTFRNQILFAGLEENSLNSASVAALQLGLRYEVYNNLYIHWKSNALIKDFSPNNLTNTADFYSGHAIGFAYNFALGPLEISAMYCDQSKRLRSYINLGIAF